MMLTHQQHITVDKDLETDIGVAYTGFDSDTDTTVNSGTIKTEGETIGVYVGLNTGAISISGSGTEI